MNLNEKLVGCRFPYASALVRASRMVQPQPEKACLAADRS